MAAYGCLRSMLTLLDGCTGLKTLLPQLEEIMFPLMQKLISSEVRFDSSNRDVESSRSIDRSIDFPRDKSIKSIDRSIGRSTSCLVHLTSVDRQRESEIDH